MFTPEKMDQIHVVFSDKDVTSVAETVVQQGTLQLVDAADVEPWAQNLDRAVVGETSEAMAFRRQRIETLLKQLNLDEDFTGIKSTKDSWNELDQQISEIEHSVQAVLSQREETRNELQRLIELKMHVQEVPQFEFSIGERNGYSYLTVETGRINDENLEILKKGLQSLLHVLTPLDHFGGRTTILVIVLRRDHERLQSILRDAGFQPLKLDRETKPLSPQIIRELNEKTENLNHRLSEIESEIEKTGKKYHQFLKSLLYTIKRNVLKRQILKYFRKTQKTYLISGWLPTKEHDNFIGEIRKATQNRCVIEVVPAEQVTAVREGKTDVPVQLKNPRLLKPFELITGAYGMPSYQTIDPTPILGISFLLMFGMMFGDVGHGLVLGIMGSLFTLKSHKELLKNIGLLLFYAGCSSVLFGILFGSVFGIEDFIPALWIRPMESIKTLLNVAIYFGIGMISLSIGINCVNALRKKKFLNIIFDKAGLLAAIVYWCGILITMRLFTVKSEAKATLPLLAVVMMFGSIVLLFLKEPIVQLIQGKRELFHEGFGTWMMGGLVEMLELILGFLSNTISFVRVAAFGLAHAGLFIAIFALSDAVGGLAGGLISFIILLLGNIMIIAFELLVVTIQAMRLEFYEFFNRFFETSTVGYRPIGTSLEES